MQRIARLNADLVVALAILVFGLAVAATGWSYPQGSLRNIGPGFLPFWLGTIVTLLALALVVATLGGRAEATEAREPFAWRPLIVVSLAILAWIFLILPTGLAPATFVLVMIASLAESPIRPITTLVNALVLSIGASILFVTVLKMPITILAW